MSLPFVIYDFLGVLFPGALVLVVIANAFGTLPGNLSSGWVAGLPQNISLSVIAAYLSGYLAEGLGRTALRFIVRKGPEKQGVPQRLGTETKLGEAVTNRIFDSIGQRYGVEARALNWPDLFDLAYSPVYNRMGKYDIFTANADLARTLLVVAALFLLECIGGSLGWISLVFPPRAAWPLTLCAVGTAAAIIFLYREQSFYRTLAHRVVYTAFLSWSGENPPHPPPG